MSELAHLNRMLKEAPIHQMSGKVAWTIKQAFLADDFELKYKRADLEVKDQESFVKRCLKMRTEFNLPHDPRRIRTVMVDPGTIQVLQEYKSRLDGPNRPIRTNTGNVLDEFLKDCKGFDKDMMENYLKIMSKRTTREGKETLKGVIWYVKQKKLTASQTWLTQEWIDWAGEPPKDEKRAAGDAEYKAQHFTSDYPVLAIDLLHDQLKIVKDKKQVLMQFQLMAVMAPVGATKVDNFLTVARSFKLPEKYLRQGIDIHEAGYLHTVSRTKKAVGIITLVGEHCVRSPCQSLCVVKNADIMKLYLQLARPEEGILEMHHELRGDFGVDFQHMAEGNARNVILQSGVIPIWNGNLN